MSTRPFPPSYSTPHGFTGHSVLVVDDDAALRGLIHHLLEHEGYTVLEAQDGQAAFDILRQRTEPLIVLTNHHMPRLDGPGLIRAVLQDPGLLGRHAFICMTGHPDGLSPAYRQQLEELCAPILRKPFDADELVTAVAAAAERLGKRNAEHAGRSEPDGDLCHHSAARPHLSRARSEPADAMATAFQGGSKVVPTVCCALRDGVLDIR